MNKDGVFIIAEAGVNHNGSLLIAKRLVDAALDAGVDAVKFQTFTAASLASKDTPKAQYQLLNTSQQESQYEMLEKLELSHDSHKALYEYCLERGIQFLSTPFDVNSAIFLNDLGVTTFKIPSGELTNKPFLKKIGAFGKPIIISTGMANLTEVAEALDILLTTGLKKEEITILHATTEYPCPFDEVNLKAMVTMRDKFGINVGYSDHTQGISIPIAAVALGAVVIEKHFTLDSRMEGPDHRASIEPAELKKMVEGIRQISVALGDGVKRPSKSEIKNLTIARKSIVASIKISRGEIFSVKNLTTKRPGGGISPMKWDEIIGTVASKDYQKDDLI